MSPQIFNDLNSRNRKKSLNSNSPGVNELLGKKIKNRFILNEFKEYLAKVEHNSENLEFFIWLDQYKTVYSALAQSNRGGDSNCEGGGSSQLPAMTTLGSNNKNSREIYNFFKTFNNNNLNSIKQGSLLNLFKKVLMGRRINKNSSDSSETTTVASEKFNQSEGYTPSIGKLSSLQSRKSNENSWKTSSQTSVTLIREEDFSNKKSNSLDIQRSNGGGTSNLKASYLNTMVEGKSASNSPNSLDNIQLTPNSSPKSKSSELDNSKTSSFDLTAIDERMDEIIPWERQIEEIVKGNRTLDSYKTLSHNYTYDNPQRISHLLSEENNNSICFDFVDELSIIHESFSIRISEMFNQEDELAINSSINNLFDSSDNNSISERAKSIVSTSTFDKANQSKVSMDEKIKNNNGDGGGGNGSNCDSLNSSIDSNLDEAYQSQKSTPPNSSPQQAPQTLTSLENKQKSVHVVPWELQLEEMENPDCLLYKKREEVEEIIVPSNLLLADHITMCLKEFIFSGASKELNIPQKLKSELYERIKESTHPDIFGPIADHVYVGLRCQSFPAFMIWSAKKMTKDRLKISKQNEKSRK